MSFVFGLSAYVHWTPPIVKRSSTICKVDGNQLDELAFADVKQTAQSEQLLCIQNSVALRVHEDQVVGRIFARDDRLLTPVLQLSQG